MATLIERAETGFRPRYGRPPNWVVAAPGRVNLIGEHTDYNGGFVLPMAVDRYVVLAADRVTGSRPSGARPHVRLYSAALKESALILADRGSQDGQPRWSRYFLGVLVACQARGTDAGSLDVWIESDTPLGGGLSSSAALEVATATLLESVTGRTLEKREKALLCQQAEHDFAGTPCGIMDQFSSVMAQPNQLILLDCRSIQGKMIPFATDEVTVLVINSNVRHELASGQYAQRRRQCEAAAKAFGVRQLRDVAPGELEAHAGKLDPVLFRRARHVVLENERTLRAAAAVSEGRWAEVGRLMYASHASLRDDYEVSCEQLDLLVDLAAGLGEAAGMIGSRMTGGGFGGCTVSLVRTCAVPHVSRAILDAYRRQSGIEAVAFATRPARGAHVVRDGTNPI